MNKLFLWLLLIAFLPGCTATTGPVQIPDASTGGTVYSTEPTAAPSTEAPSEVSQEPAPGAQPELQWENFPLLRLLPEPGEDLLWVQAEEQFPAEEFRIVTEEGSLDFVKSYIEAVKAAGFCMESRNVELVDYREKVVDISYYACNNQGTYVMVTGEELSSCWYSQIMVCAFPDGVAPADAVPTQEDWDHNALRALLPQPPTAYWEATDENTVQLSYCTLEQMRNYALQLRLQGFDSHTYEYTGMGHYYFSGENAQGYAVKLEWDLTKKPYPVLRIGPTDALEYPLWVYSYYYNIFLPEPESWHVQRQYSELEIYLYSLDLQGAKEYLAECEAFAKKNGKYIHWSREKEEDGVFSIDFNVLERVQGGNDGKGCWRLVYDPDDSQCPCKLISVYFW